MPSEVPYIVMHFNRPAKKDTGPRYLIDRILPLGYCAALLGKRECGKSSLAAAIARAVASGEPFARRATTMGGVLWLAAGESPFRTIAKGMENYPVYVTYARPPIDTRGRHRGTRNLGA
ncbi:MAG: AAA family ATPase [Fimbriimonadales bacterium]